MDNFEESVIPPMKPLFKNISNIGLTFNDLLDTIEANGINYDLGLLIRKSHRTIFNDILINMDKYKKDLDVLMLDEDFIRVFCEALSYIGYALDTSERMVICSLLWDYYLDKSRNEFLDNNMHLAKHVINLCTVLNKAIGENMGNVVDVSTGSILAVARFSSIDETICLSRLTAVIEEWEDEYSVDFVVNLCKAFQLTDISVILSVIMETVLGEQVSTNGNTIRIALLDMMESESIENIYSVLESYHTNSLLLNKDGEYLRTILSKVNPDRYPKILFALKSVYENSNNIIL